MVYLIWCSGRPPFLSVQLFHYLTLKIRSKLKSKHQRRSSRSSVQKGVYSKRRKHISMRHPGATEISPRFSPFYTCGQGSKRPLGPSSWSLLFSFLTLKSQQNVPPMPLLWPCVSSGCTCCSFISVIVIIKGASNIGLLSGSYSLFAYRWDCKGYSQIYLHAWSWPSFPICHYNDSWSYNWKWESWAAAVWTQPL